MEILDLGAFLSYYEKTRQITTKVIEAIPHDKLDWAYMAGKFTIGDLLRHIASIERNVFAQIASGKKPAYTGCSKELADGYENVISYFNEMHRQSLEIFRSLGDDRLKEKVTSVDGKKIV